MELTISTPLEPTRWVTATGRELQVTMLHSRWARSSDATTWLFVRADATGKIAGTDIDGWDSWSESPTSADTVRRLPEEFAPLVRQQWAVLP